MQSSRNYIYLTSTVHNNLKTGSIKMFLVVKKPCLCQTISVSGRQKWNYRRNITELCENCGIVTNKQDQDVTRK